MSPQSHRVLLAIAVAAVLAAPVHAVAAAGVEAGDSSVASVSGAASPAATGAVSVDPDAGAPLAVAAANGTASFDDDRVRVDRGDRFNVTVSHSAPAVFHLTSGDYLLRVALDGSGTTTIEVDTYNASAPADEFVTGGNASAPNGPAAGPLAATKYVMNVTVDGVERDIGTVNVRPRADMAAAASVAPGSFELDDATPGDLRAAASPGGTVAAGDLAAVRLDERSLESALRADDLDGDAGANGIAVEFVAREREPNSPRHRFYATDGAVTVLPAFGDDEVFFVWNTSDLAPPEPRTYDVNVTLVGDHNGLVDRNVTVARTRVTVEPTWFSLTARPSFTIDPWNDSSLAVTGRTNLAPGSELEVRSRAEEPVFLKTRTVSVGSDGSFNATFQYGDVGRGFEAPLWVLGHRSATEATVRVRDDNASVDVRDQVADDVLVLRRVSLGAGGFVSLAAGAERILATTSYLDPGVHRDLAVRLDRPLNESTTVRAVVHYDRDRNRSFDSIHDQAYDRDGHPVNDTADVTVPSEATETPTATPAGTPNATPTPAPSATPSRVAVDVPVGFPVREEPPLNAATNADAPLSPALAVVAFVLAGLRWRRSL